MNTITAKEKKEFLEIASDFNEYANKHNWVSRYDAESDALSVAASELSDDARIKYFDDEVAFYITKDHKIEGVFIEYFKSNFVNHHKDLKEIFKDLDSLKNKEGALVKVGKIKVKKLAPDLEETMREALAEKLNISFQVQE